MYNIEPLWYMYIVGKYIDYTYKFHTGGNSSSPPPKAGTIFHANDTDQSYNPIITIHLKRILNL